MTSPTDPALLRIAFAVPHLRPGGIEVGVLALANELTARGHVVHLFLRHRKGSLLDELDTGVHRHDARGRRALALSGWLARGLRREGVQLLYSGTNAMNLAAALAVRRMRPEDRPAHLLSEHTTAAEYLAKAKWPAARLWAMRRLYGRADRLVAPLDGLAQGWLDHLGLDHPPPATLPNPVLGRILPGAGETAKNERSGLIAVGRLHPDKGFDRLIDAVALMKDQTQQLTIWGEGAARPQLEALITAKGLGHRVQMPGLTRDLPQKLSAARVLIVPSRREGFGNVVIEALAAATPVIATDCAGPAKLLANAERAGHLVPRDGPDVARDLADAITRMLASPEGLADAARLGPAIAAPYHIDAATEAFLALAYKVCAERRLHML